MEEIIFDKSSEEYKAIEWLKNKTNDYSEHSLILHYNNTLYYLIVNLMKKNEKLENVILGLECDVEVLSEQIEDDCMAHEEALKWYKEAQELAFEEAGQRQKINKAIEYIEEAFKEDELNEGNIYHSVYDDLFKILRG